MQKADYEVIFRQDGSWIHQRTGSHHPLGIFGSEQEAWIAAQDAARKDHVIAFLRAPNGEIRDQIDFRLQHFGPPPHHPLRPPRGPRR